MQIEGIDNFIRSPNRRTLSISISREAKVSVRAPMNMPMDAVCRFVHDKKSWIEAKKNAILQRNASSVPKEFVEGEDFLFKGQPYQLQFEADAAIPIVFDKAFIISERYRHKARQMLVGWYEMKAEQIIGERVKVYAEAFLIDYSKVKVVDSRSQWGSCTIDGNLSFCWRLVMCPTRIIDYVVAHELAHRRHMNHSPAFWALVAKMRPDYKEQQQWLKDNSPLLRF